MLGTVYKNFLWCWQWNDLLFSERSGAEPANNHLETAPEDLIQAGLADIVRTTRKLKRQSVLTEYFQALGTLLLFIHCVINYLLELSIMLHHNLNKCN
jgi:hypothetical protein